MKSSIIHYCAEIGRDPMLVQGAGGNVSWKDKTVLHVKASGMWLAEAGEKDIFVAVDLAHLRSALASGTFDATPRVSSETPLRPSIETMLHALMPHPVVVHLHMIEALAYLVRSESRQALKEVLPSDLRWIFVDYHKPGPELAKAINPLLIRQPDTDVIFLKNHGVVIGAENTFQIKRIVNTLLEALNTRVPPWRISAVSGIAAEEIKNNYFPLTDPQIQQLAFDEILFARLSDDWAIYPDHVVFLGARPFCFAGVKDLHAFLENTGKTPDLIFIRNVGVFAQATFSQAKLVQLRCFYEVLARQTGGFKLDVLRADQIADLLNWDAEQYRRSLSQGEDFR